ncbi:radical SAM protein [Methanomicrobium mobile]|uniref:radical SAM protein n=1 Tax=Methanomicrobium mobile TaxID=2205 RepID=UPI0005B258CF|nr:radical SAM protein [Methanomicrobium mobile]
MEYRYIFGPVPSRRLGISLGVDLIPPKTCSYNCIYCESGKTTNLTVERREYVPLNDVLKELDGILKTHPRLDFVTYSGSGEPTLYSRISEVTRFVKENYPEYKTALLTNGSLFHDEKVRRDCLDIDVVIPSLDCAGETEFKKVDRPHHSLSAAVVNEGIAKFRTEYTGQIWLEIFIVPGINDTDEEIGRINAEIAKIRPDKIQLNTLDRPGAVDWIRPADDIRMQEIAGKLRHDNIEIAGKPATRSSNKAYSGDISDVILRTVRRRPCTLDDIVKITGLHMNEVNKYLGVLVAEGKITEARGERGVFYRSAE